MKKFISLLLSVLMIMSLVCIPVSAADKTASISFGQKEVTMTEGTAIKLKPTVTGISADKLKWSSSNSKVCRVTSEGKVYAYKNGKAVITAASGELSAKCYITVGTKVTAVTVSEKSITLSVGDTYTINASVKPSDASNKKLSYSTSSKAAAAVSSKGIIKANKPGKAVITVKSCDGTNKKASIKVTVVKKEASGSSSDNTQSEAPVIEGFNTKMTGFDIVADMQIGWNLGNSLDATNSNSISDSGNSTETCWGNPVTSKKMIDAVKAQGFKAIRIPVSWHNHLDADLNINKDWLKRVKEVVDYAADNDMYIIINMHHDNCLYDLTENGSKATVERITKIWKQIAAYFSNYNEKLLFEGFNEPRTEGSAKEWIGGTAEERKVVNAMNEAFIKTVRATGGKNKYRFLLIPGYGASSSEVSLKDIKLPKDDRVIIEVHAYNPYNFAMNANASGTFTDNDKKQLDWLFGFLNDNFIKKGYPVIIDEMGATNKDNLDDRVEWTKYYVSNARKYGITCFWWDNNYSKKGGEAFGIFNRLSCKFNCKEIADALVKYSK